jgi:hypothetical protein
MVHSEIIKLNPGDPTADRGVKHARFVVIKQNVLPAILVEGGFVSNHMESARVNRSDYRQSLAEAIARGIIRFVNVMGDRNLELPGMSQEAPKAIAVVPPAPSGLARDPANGKTVSTSSSATASGTKLKKDKTKKTATTSPAPIHAPASVLAPLDEPGSSIDASAPVPPVSTTPVAPLDLAEPAPPTPAPGADKAPPEPDEPPTVDIYPTTPPSSAPAPATTTPATNAPPDPTPVTNP